MPAPTPDGDALFTAFALTVIKSATPRDGGKTLAAFCDWLTERFHAGAACVCVYDQNHSGAALVVRFCPGDDIYDFLLAGLLNADSGGVETYAESFGADAFGKVEFRDFLAEAMNTMWRQ